MKEFLDGISSYGFPVVVAGYLLFRFENKVEKMTEKLDELTSVIKELKATIRK